MTIDTRAGLPVFSTQFGTGDEPALMIHCGMTHSGVWGRLAGELGDLLSMTAFDLPGHGKTGEWDHARPFHDLATDIAQSFFDKPMHLIGHSVGATVALRLAQAHPERVKTLTLIEPVLFAAAREVAPDVLARHAEGAEPLEQALEAKRYEEAAELFFGTWGGGAPWSALPVEKQAEFAKRVHTVTGTKAHLYDDVAGLTSPGRLEAVTCPVLLVRGSGSPEIVAAIHDGLAARMPNVTSHVVEGAQHLLAITHPKPIAGWVRAMIEGSLARADAGLLAT